MIKLASLRDEIKRTIQLFARARREEISPENLELIARYTEADPHKMLPALISVASGTRHLTKGNEQSQMQYQKIHLMEKFKDALRDPIAGHSINKVELVTDPKGPSDFRKVINIDNKALGRYSFHMPTETTGSQLIPLTTETAGHLGSRNDGIPQIDSMSRLVVIANPELAKSPRLYFAGVADAKRAAEYSRKFPNVPNPFKNSERFYSETIPQNYLDELSYRIKDMGLLKTSNLSNSLNSPNSSNMLNTVIEKIALNFETYISAGAKRISQGREAEGLKLIEHGILKGILNAPKTGRNFLRSVKSLDRLSFAAPRLGHMARRFSNADIILQLGKAKSLAKTHRTGPRANSKFPATYREALLGVLNRKELTGGIDKSYLINNVI